MIESKIVDITHLTVLHYLKLLTFMELWPKVFTHMASSDFQIFSNQITLLITCIEMHVTSFGPVKVEDYGPLGPCSQMSAMVKESVTLWQTLQHSK